MTQINFKSGIYQIRNKTNERFYIGSAINLKKRRAEHFRLLGHGSHKNRFLQNDFNKCGKDAFEFSVTEPIIEKFLIQKEQHYLDQFYDNQNKCYNLIKKAGGNYNLSGVLHHASKKAFCWSKEVQLIAKYSNARIASENTNVNATSINLACNNKIKSAGGFIWTFSSNTDITKKLSGVWRKSPKVTGVNYELVSPENQIVKITNITKFCQKNNLNYQSIRDVIKGRRQSCYGWRRVENDNY